MSTSKHEEDFLLELEAHGVDVPVREYAFAAELGRRFRFDFAWPDKKIYVEIEGGVWVSGRHNRAYGFIRDAEKYNLATLLGWRGLRFTTNDMKKNMGRCVRMLQAVLAGGGPKGAKAVKEFLRNDREERE